MDDKIDRKSHHSNSQRILNRLLAIEQHSLANYLLYAPPWRKPGDEPLVNLVHHIAAEQQASAARIGQLLYDRYGYAEPSQFPLEFTAYDDLAVDYLLRPLLEHQRKLLEEIQRCVEKLSDDPEAKQLAQEVLASEQQHLERLEQLRLPSGDGKQMETASRQSG